METSFRERQVEETTYETVTEMREQRYMVEKPVIETQMREERVVVRKPVTSTIMQTENVTTLKPITVNETQFVPGVNIRNDLVLESGRNRLRWLRPGVYVNPSTGQAGYRRAGLHWVPDQSLVVRPTAEPTLDGTNGCSNKLCCGNRTSAKAGSSNSIRRPDRNSTGSCPSFDDFQNG